MSSNINSSGDLFQVIAELERPEIQESLTELIGKLPDIQRALDSAENIVAFGKSVLEDRESLGAYEQAASTYNINGETIAALIALAEKLPKLVQLIDQLENIMDFITSVLQDQESTDYILTNVKEYTDPIMRQGSNTLNLIREVREKAACGPQNIRFISIVKWLKDPVVQRGLCYVQAALDIMNEKNNNNH